MGWKQSPRLWNAALNNHLQEMGFVQTKEDPCIYVYKNRSSTVIIAVYVDDILIAAKSDARITEVKTAIASQFETTDMGKLHYFLGVKVFKI